MEHKTSFIVLLIVLLTFIQSEKANEKKELEINIYKAKTSNSSSGASENNYIENSDAIFLSVSHFRLRDSYLAFNAYFAPIKNYSIFPSMTFPIYIDYDAALKKSDEIDIKCSLQELQTKADQKVSYRCETNSIKERIKLINLIPNFNFIPNKKENLLNATNITYNVIDKDNIIPYNDRNISNKNVTIFVMHNTSFTKNSQNTFILNGRPSHEIPIYKYQTVILMTEKKDGTDVDIDCFIYQERIFNYTLKCRADVTEEIVLDDSIGLIDDEILLLFNFNEDGNHTIDLYVENKLVKKSTKIKPGIIVFLVLGICLAVIAFALSLFLGSNTKRKDNLESKNNSDVVKINSIN